MKIDYKRNLRKWVALAIAVVCYFLIHEGAHWVYAMSAGVFKQINIISIGIQVEPYTELMSDIQLGIFCLLGPVSTIVVSYVLLALTPRFLAVKSDYARAITYFSTLALLIIDPMYLSILSLFVGGGDMKGLILILPEMAVRVLFGMIAAINIFIVFKIVVPKYRQAFQKGRTDA
jgi:hypothetical protein